MDNSTKDPKKDKLLEHKAAKGYLKYSGMAFQIAAYIIVGLLVGKQLDKYFETSRPLFAAGGAVLFLVAYLIKLIADVNQGKV